MSEPTFKFGDVVLYRPLTEAQIDKLNDLAYLPNNGPPMRVAEVSGDRVTCTWIDRNWTFQRVEFPSKELTIIAEA